MKTSPAPPRPRWLGRSEGRKARFRDRRQARFRKTAAPGLRLTLADYYVGQNRKDDARPILAKNADYLKRWSSTRLIVEGHCDERGSGEYNLGLGERRANAVKQYLVNLGVAADRVNVVSKGKEAPVCSETNESCWQQNRRGHFVFTAK